MLREKWSTQLPKEGAYAKAARDKFPTGFLDHESQEGAYCACRKCPYPQQGTSGNWKTFHIRLFNRFAEAKAWAEACEGKGDKREMSDSYLGDHRYNFEKNHFVVTLEVPLIACEVGPDAEFPCLPDGWVKRMRELHGADWMPPRKPIEPDSAALAAYEAELNSINILDIGRAINGPDWTPED